MVLAGWYSRLQLMGFECAIYAEIDSLIHVYAYERRDFGSL